MIRGLSRLRGLITNMDQSPRPSFFVYTVSSLGTVLIFLTSFIVIFSHELTLSFFWFGTMFLVPAFFMLSLSYVIFRRLNSRRGAALIAVGSPVLILLVLAAGLLFGAVQNQDDSVILLLVGLLALIPVVSLGFSVGQKPLRWKTWIVVGPILAGVFVWVFVSTLNPPDRFLEDKAVEARDETICQRIKTPARLSCVTRVAQVSRNLSVCDRAYSRESLEWIQCRLSATVWVKNLEACSELPDIVSYDVTLGEPSSPQRHCVEVIWSNAIATPFPTDAEGVEVWCSYFETFAFLKEPRYEGDGRPKQYQSLCVKK